MRFRIGVHLGDVMVDGGDLFGEGVNLAARLQSMAEPGGVLISQAVYDQVRSKLAIGYEFLGERQPKNLDETVPVYRLLLEGSAPPVVNRAPVPEPRADPKLGAPAAASSDVRTELVRLAQQLGIIWVGLFAIDMVSGTELWSVWPGIAFLVVLGLQAAPLLARGWVDVQFARCGVITAALALINLASGSSRPWFLWPAGALLAVVLLRRTWRSRP